MGASGRPYFGDFRDSWAVWDSPTFRAIDADGTEAGVANYLAGALEADGASREMLDAIHFGYRMLPNPKSLSHFCAVHFDHTAGEFRAVGLDLIAALGAGGIEQGWADLDGRARWALYDEWRVATRDHVGRAASPNEAARVLTNGLYWMLKRAEDEAPDWATAAYNKQWGRWLQVGEECATMRSLADDEREA